MTALAARQWTSEPPKAIQTALGHLRHCFKVGSLNAHDAGLVSSAIIALESIAAVEQRGSEWSGPITPPGGE